jgi:hypothetical protein
MTIIEIVNDALKPTIIFNDNGGFYEQSNFIGWN